MAEKSIEYIYLDDGFEIIKSQGQAYAYGLHNHTSVFVLAILLSGHLNVDIDGKESKLDSGDVFVVRPYVPHKLLPEGEYTLMSICLHKNRVWDDGERTFNRLQELLDSYEVLTKKQRRRLMRGYRKLAALPREVVRYDEKLRTLLEIYPERHMSVDEMAEMVHWSKYHFIRYFKKRIGLTPYQFLLQNRIRKGQRLLRKGYSVAEVAMATGFCDQSHFNKYFIRIVGMTPIDYRKACK